MENLGTSIKQKLVARQGGVCGIKAIRERQNSNSTPNDRVACVTSGILRARKVSKEEMQNRAENGKETLLPSVLPPKLSHAQKNNSASYAG